MITEGTGGKMGTMEDWWQGDKGHGGHKGHNGGLVAM